MTHILASIAMAVVAGALRLLWSFEHEHTAIRAPWTGLTYAGSALAFVAVGLLGRGWRALTIAIVAAATTVLLDPPVWDREPTPRLQADCDPGCISLEARVVIDGAAAAALAAAGMVLRRAVGWARRHASHAAA